MEENKEVLTINHNFSPKFNRSLRMDRFARIFFNLTVAAVVIASLAAIATIFIPLAQLFLIVLVLIFLLGIIVFTFGAAFAMPGNPVGQVWEFLGKITKFDSMSTLITHIINAIPYVCIVGLVTSVVALFLAIFNKYKREVGRIVALSIFIVLLIVGIIIFFALGGCM